MGLAYLIGVILGVIAVMEILDEPISLMGKIITIAFVLLLSWVGLAVYYLILRRNLYRWFR